VEHHRFDADADPYPDPTFQFDADPTPSLHVLENHIFLLLLFAPLQIYTNLHLSRQCYRCHNFQYFGEGSGKSKVNQTLSLHLVVYGYKSGSEKMMPIQPDPDTQN
jgi:hypothetical protein